MNNESRGHLETTPGYISPALMAMGACLMGVAAAACASSDESAAGLNRSSDGSGFSSFDNAPGGDVTQSTNVNLGGSQDIGFFRGQLEAGLVPSVESLDAAGFFAEHHSELPPAACGQRVCLQPMMAVMGNLMNGNNCTMLELGLNSPLAADPGQRPPLSLAVVVDVSGSMQGNKIAFVRDGLQLLIDGMKDGDQLSLVTYSDGASVVSPMGEVEGQRVELRQAAEGLSADGGTNLYAGLEAGYREVLGHYDSGRQNRVILLSDGQPTVGVTGTESIVQMSRAYNSDGVGLTTVGLGADFNIELMRDLALQADGNFYFLEDAGAVNEVFTEELSFFVVPVAFDLSLKLTAGSDYDFGRALGTPFWQDTAQGGELQVPSVFLAHRESDEDVTEDDGRRGGGSSLLVELMPSEDARDEEGATVATIELQFREPGSDELLTDTVKLDYPHLPGELLPQGFFEAENLSTVQKSFVMLNIFVGMEQAVTAFHEGRANESTLMDLENLIAAVEDYNEEIKDTDVELDLELLTMLRQNLWSNGVARPEPERIAIPDDPWPAD